MATRIALYEAGAEANYLEVDPKTKIVQKDGSDFRAVNPLGLVPTLRTDDGLVLTENAAILQYVADRYPQAGMAAGWNVRVDQFAERDPIDMVWDGGMIAGDAWVIPFGAPNTDVAMDFINFATRAIPTANFSRLVPYGPVNLASFPLIREDRHALLPTSPQNLDVQFIQNWNWWSDNLEEIQARFDQWIIDGPPAG